MADISSSTFSETASSNNAASPDGWPEGMAYSGVNDSARETHAAIKRLYNRDHATATTGGTSTAYTLTYTTSPGSYVQGMQFAFRVNADCGAAPTLNINTIGAKSIKRADVSGLVTLAAADLKNGQVAVVQYDSSADAFILVNPVANASGLVYITEQSASSSATIDFTSTYITSRFQNYLVTLTDVLPATNGADLWMRFDMNGGASFDAGASDYRWAHNLQELANAVAADTGSSGDTKISLAGSVDSSAGYVSGDLFVRCGAKSHVSGNLIHYNGSTIYGAMRYGYYPGGTANAIRFLFSSGNIASGKFRLYGFNQS